MTKCPVCNQEIPSGLVISLSGRFSRPTIVCPHCSATLKLSGRTRNLLTLVFLGGLGLAFLFWYIDQITGDLIYAGIAFVCLIATGVTSVVVQVRSSRMEPVISSGKRE